MLPLHLADLPQDLAQQIHQTPRYLLRLALAVTALLPIRQVGLLHVQVLCPGAMDAQALTHPTHHCVSFFDTLPEQFLVRRVAHLTLVARRIRVHRIEVFHPGLPCLRELLLQFLYLHLPGQLRGNVIQ